MNKQELIEKYEKLEGVYTDPGAEIARLIFLEDLRELDEPQKVTVPQIVADYIEYTKATDWDLQEAMDDVAYEDNKDLRKWFNDNIETFVRAWLDGYEVEEEKRYYVRFKFIEDSYSYLTLIKHLSAWTLHSITLDKKFRTEHTRKQLEDANFGWVFDCPGIEIEEVDDE